MQKTFLWKMQFPGQPTNAAWRRAPSCFVVNLMGLWLLRSSGFSHLLCCAMLSGWQAMRNADPHVGAAREGRASQTSQKGFRASHPPTTHQGPLSLVSWSRVLWQESERVYPKDVAAKCIYKAMPRPGFLARISSRWRGPYGRAQLQVHPWRDKDVSRCQPGCSASSSLVCEART